MVSDHCHATGTPRAALCRLCNGNALLAAMETMGKTDAEVRRALEYHYGWRGDFVTGMISRARMYITAWQPVSAAHVRWRETWHIESGRRAPNRFVLAVWAGMARTVLVHNPSAGAALGLGNNPLRALLSGGAARHKDMTNVMRIAEEGMRMVISLDVEAN